MFSLLVLLPITALPQGVQVYPKASNAQLRQLLGWRTTQKGAHVGIKGQAAEGAGVV